jgi:signal transduction histidine kinase
MSAAGIGLSDMTTSLRPQVPSRPFGGLPVQTSAVAQKALLAELVGNLLANAVKYNRLQGWIVLDTHADGDHVVLEVSNSGQQIADPDLAGLLEPFRRADQPRIGNSSGLGLSIVRAVAAAHAGELHLRALADGGLAVRVRLPAAPRRAGA